MTRIESIISLLKANTGAKTISVTDVATYANYADSITLETISAGIMATSPLKAAFAGLPTADLLDQMFISLFGYTQAQVDELRATEAGAAGFQYWADEIANNSDMININTLAIALLNGAVAAEAAGNGTDGTKAAELVAADVAAYKAYAGETETPGETEGQPVYLTSNQDILVGADGNDTFIARGNNTLNNADIIDGGKGKDTVFVMLDKGETAESPLLTNVEILKVQVQSTTTDSGDNEVDLGTRESNIDAGDMTSVTTYINDNSRADLTIEDVSRNSHITTLVMKETSSITSDYTVLFDPDNITGPGKSDEGATLVIDIVNLLSAANGESPVANFSTLDFKVGDVEIVVEIPKDGSYADLVASIEAALAAKNILTVDVDMQVSSVAFNKDLGGYPKGYDVTYQQIVLTNNSSAKLVEGDIKLLDSSKKGDLFYDMNPEAGTETPSLTQTNVVFDRVGRSDTKQDGHLVQGGKFVAGSDAVSTDGIEQFNVSVDRDSWLTSVASTANKLEVINIKNIKENSNGNGTLAIKGTNGEAGVTDVRVIDASKMTGKADISAELTDKVVSKYLDLKDTQSNPAGDNSDKNFLKVVDTYFSYDFGSNNDTFSLTIDGSNLAAAGTTTREDFIMEINGGAGNDTITTDIIGTLTANGYANSKLNANLTINGGEGNDTIWTKGEGDIKINAGTGNDTVYTDNTGTQTTAGVDGKLGTDDDLFAYNDGKATFVFNAVNSDINDLQSAGNTTVATGVNLGLTVTFQGVTTDISQIANSFGSSKNVAVTALHVNQAIKDAINNDAVLSKVLVAVDGPANTLIVNSLIDGVMTANDLTVNFGQLTYTATPTLNDIWDISKHGVSKSTYDSQLAAALGTAIVAPTYADKLATDGAAGITTGTITFAGTEADSANEVLTTTITDSLGNTYTFTTTVTASTAATAAATVVSAVIPAVGATKTFTVTEAAGVVTIVSVDGTAFTAITAQDTTDATPEITAGALVGTVLNEYTGANASHLGTDNTINLGTGNDVLVLSTDSNSKETIIFNDANFGDDVIFNFTSGDDVLNFSAFVSVANATTKVAAGNKYTDTAFNSDLAATDTANLAAAVTAYTGVVAADHTSTSIVFLLDNAGAGADATKAYAYQINDALGTAAGTTTATFLGSIDLDTTFAIGDVIA